MDNNLREIMLRQKEGDDSQNKHLHIQETIKICVVTWNLQGSLPPHNSLKMLMTEIIESSKNSAPDIIAIGTQQCQRSLCLSFFCQDKSEWENMIIDSSNGYSFITSETLQGLHLAILVKKNLTNCCTMQKKTVVRAGTCNLLGNKGAVSISINLLGQNLQFVTCHLAASQNESERRNQTLLNITDNLIDKDFRTQAFIFGDLNYRIDMSKSQYYKLLEEKGIVKGKEGDFKKGKNGNTEENMNYSSMLGRDQLIRQQVLKDRFLTFFNEEPIKFPPTYKLSPDSGEYCHTRIPGWTDRIFNRKGRAAPINYKCMYKIYGTDHRPVLANFQLQTEQGLSIFPDEYIQVGKSSGCQLI